MTGSRLGFVLAAVMVPAAAGAQVRFERTGYRLTSIGERLAVSARVVDARRQPVANANIRWHVADPTIATVSGEGIIVSKKVGYTKLWAVAGKDSASALILVDQWAAKFDFMPALVRLDAVGATKPLRIMVRDAAGHIIPEENRKTTSCRSLDPRIATLSASGEVTALSNGATYVRCTDRGIADSVRVLVRQRVDRAVIADKGAFTSRQMGDTFRLQIRAQDSRGDVIRDVQATWASLNSSVVSIDPLTGLARSVGPGDVKIIAQAGDVTDTLAIRVQPPFGMAMPVASADTTSGLLPEIAAPRIPTLNIASLYPFEGDTTPITVTARDATGTIVANPSIVLRSTDTSVIVVLPRQRVLPKKQGSAYLIGAFGTVIDSTLVSVRARGSGRGLALADESASASFKRPTFDTAAARIRSAAAIKAIRDSIFRSSSVGRVASGRLLSFAAVAGQARHSFSDSTGTERRSGLLYGGTVEVAPWRWIKLNADFRTGTLTSNALAGGTDLTVTEAEADLTLQPADWFGLRAGYMKRALREGEPGPNKVALQQWSSPRVSIVTRFNFVGDVVSTVMAVTMLPAAQYTGYYDAQNGKSVNPNPFSLAGEAGVDLHAGWLRAGLMYYVEKFTFPKVGTSLRVDQFSALRLRLGLETPR